ncbi:MAG: transcriptional regulator [Clostridia bacterium]|nr:transcriptional regulator [Clostridia bacterium]
MDLNFLERLSKAIAAQFGNHCEVAIHDLQSGDMEHTIALIENGHVTHRQKGDGPSRVVLEALKSEDPKALSDSAGYLMRTHDGRILKCATVYIRDENGVPEGIFSINYDMTELLTAEHAIGSLLHHNEEEKKTPERIPQSVNELLDDLIEQSVQLVGKPVAMMNKDDKIKAIAFLNKAGAFLITRSGDKVSKYFGISKYTLYSYIDATNTVQN